MRGFWKIGIPIALIVVAMLAILSTACEKEEGTQSAKKMADKAVTAMGEVKTYQFDMDTTMEMACTEDEKAIEMSISSNGSGVVDDVNQKMKMDMTMSMTLPEEAGMPGSMEMEQEMYFIENMIYMKMSGGQIPPEVSQWMKMPMPEGTWDTQNQIEMNKELLESAEVKQLGDEKVNGVNCYVLEVKPDMDKLWEVMSQQKSLGGILEGIEVSPKDVIKEMNLKYWIAKDTSLPAKVSGGMVTVMNSEDLNLPAEEGEFEVTMNTDYDVSYSSYGESVSIELPPEAKEAIEIPMMP